MLQGFDIDHFLTAIEQGDALVDFDARTRHNHGTKFRFRQDRIPEVYRTSERVSSRRQRHVGVLAIRDLKGVLDREKEPIGILLTLNPPTKDMITEAGASAFYENDFWKKKYPRLQILTVLDILKGKRPDMPWSGSPFAKAPTEKERAEQEAML